MNSALVKHSERTDNCYDNASGVDRVLVGNGGRGTECQRVLLVGCWPSLAGNNRSIDLFPLVVPLVMLVWQVSAYVRMARQFLVPVACIPSNCVA